MTSFERSARIAGNATGGKARLSAGPETPQERVRRWQRRAAIVAAVALAGVMGYGVIFGNNGLIVYEHKRQETRELARQMQVLERENARLSVHVERLQSDPDAIEHQAREALHYTRAGEVIYTLPAHHAAAADTPSAAR
jgi:cell division protein FtsB